MAQDYEELPEDVEEVPEDEEEETDVETTLRFIRHITMFVISLLVYNLIRDGTNGWLYFHFEILVLFIVLLACLRVNMY